PRFRGTPGMSAIGRHLARDLDVRTGVRVASITPVVPGGAGGAVESIGGSGAHSPETRWRVALEATERDDRAEPRALEADALLLTAPVPQSLALLDAGATALSATDRAALDRVSYDPCIAVLAELDGPSRLPPPGALDPGSEPIGWISDDLAKGVSPTPTATIHATARWSALHFERDREESARELLQAAAPLLGVGVRGYRVHGWRFARPSVLHEGPCRVARDLPPLVFAGDAFVAPRVEGAFLSGLAAVEALLERMSPGRST
ncbi:MAG: NAD(P)/FAD-dependent oxidoreductase, partial [Alphaproteobacteria bacterium]